ncbi:MAG: AMP-binding protein [Acidobacteria bacterium]|nr:AMP-binding protein [Acidobacteriota bacterium]
MTESLNTSPATPENVPELCLKAFRRYAKSDAVNLKHGGQWLHIPADAVEKRVRAVALGLAALGVRKGDRVALLSENRPDWTVADLAILSLGGSGWRSRLWNSRAPSAPASTGESSSNS